MADHDGPPGPNSVRERRYPRRTYAALDLGTNNCRLLIARPASVASGEAFVIVDAFSRIVRLGEGLSASGRLSDAAIDRAIAALGVCADKLVRRGVHLSRAVATQACRQAANGPEFVERVYRETGIVLDIIDASEEARLAVAGCVGLMEPGDGAALVFDIGGGSTELIRLETREDSLRIVEWISVPWGVVSLSEQHGRECAERADRIRAYDAMRDTVTDALFAFARPPEGEALRLLGTSGTITTLASVFLNLPSYDRRAVDGLRVPTADIRRIGRELAAMSLAERSTVPCIGQERADLVVAGCAILEAILDLWPAVRVGVADRGIREGILRALVATGA